MLKKILRDSLPTMISLTLSGMYSVVDGIFIGRAAGDTGLAAINIAWPITAVITALGIGIGTGGSVLVSHYRGKQEQEESRRAKDNTLSLLIVTGIGITALLLLCYPGLLTILGAKGEVYRQALRYSEIIVMGSLLQVLGTGLLPVLRNMDMAVAAMISMMIGLFANIGINYYLMFEKNMGIRGAAYGTVAAQGLVAGISMVLLVRRQRIGFYLNQELSKHTVRTGITAFGMSIAPSVTLIFTNWQCLAYGGAQAVACYAVISYITFPVQYMLSGIGDGTQPLMSFYHGAGKEREVEQIKRIAYILAGIIGTIAAVTVIVLSPRIGGWFGLSSQAAVYFEAGMKVSALSFFLLGYVKFHTSYLNAVLQTRKAILLTYAESFLVTPVLLYLLPVFAGISGVWAALPVTSVCMLFLYQLVRQYNTGQKKADTDNRSENGS